MPEEASDEQSQGGISGFGALSHVYMQYPPLRCNAPGTQRLYYDNGNKLLLAPLSDHVLSYKVGTSQLDPHSSDFVGGGPVLFIRYSLDAKLIGIHRSNHEIQFKNRESGQIFSHICKTDTERILGFFWTDCPSCDLILIKTSWWRLNNLMSVSMSILMKVGWFLLLECSAQYSLVSGLCSLA
ncbi:uncharacterized protein LOC122032630 [Zingiber officinale]|uniref:uncharacterized protein LOC122032630 n=1 Tax=Zingiber officinale TaxID=94328 RepID=UPI001C4D4417|nr:uncharacterized protein LOC122032630 [Zingiber officinale]